MALTVRLDPSLESSFARVCKRRGVSKSQVVMQAIKAIVERDSAVQPTLGELGRGLFWADTTRLPKGKRSLFQFIEAGAVSVADISISDLKGFSSIMTKYIDRRVDLADASLVLLAEQSGATDIITIDRTDFSTYRLSRNRGFNILFP